VEWTIEMGKGDVGFVIGTGSVFCKCESRIRSVSRPVTVCCVPGSEEGDSGRHRRRFQFQRAIDEINRMEKEKALEELKTKQQEEMQATYHRMLEQRIQESIAEIPEVLEVKTVDAVVSVDQPRVEPGVEPRKAEEKTRVVAQQLSLDLREYEPPVTSGMYNKPSWLKDTVAPTDVEKPAPDVAEPTPAADPPPSPSQPVADMEPLPDPIQPPPPSESTVALSSETDAPELTPHELQIEPDVFSGSVPDPLDIQSAESEPAPQPEEVGIITNEEPALAIADLPSPPAPEDSENDLQLQEESARDSTRSPLEHILGSIWGMFQR